MRIPRGLCVGFPTSECVQYQSLFSTSCGRRTYHAEPFFPCPLQFYSCIAYLRFKECIFLRSKKYVCLVSDPWRYVLSSSRCCRTITVVDSFVPFFFQHLKSKVSLSFVILSKVKRTLSSIEHVIGGVFLGARTIGLEL